MLHRLDCKTFGSFLEGLMNIAMVQEYVEGKATQQSREKLVIELFHGTFVRCL